MGIVIALLLAFAPGSDWPPFHVVSPNAVFPPPPPKHSTQTVSFSGHFAPDGSVATMEFRISYASGVTEDTQARILTKACRSKTSRLDFGPMAQAPIAILDLDGDGRDEVFLEIGANGFIPVALLRVDGCRIVAVERKDSPREEFSLVTSFGGSSDSGGAGILCRRTGTGKVEVLQILNSPWTELDMSDPEHPVTKQNEQVSWTRTVFVLRGNELVVTAKDTGTSRVPNDPTVPLFNHFDCLGAIYPPGDTL